MRGLKWIWVILFVGVVVLFVFSANSSISTSRTSTGMAVSFITPAPIPPPPTRPTEEDVLEVAEVTGKPGEKVTVPILVRVGKPVRSVQVNLAYDGLALLNPVGERGPELPEEWTFASHSPGLGDMRALAFSWNPDGDAKPLDGTVFEVSFTVAIGARGDLPITVQLSDVRNKSNKAVSITVHSGVVKVVP